MPRKKDEKPPIGRDAVTPRIINGDARGHVGDDRDDGGGTGSGLRKDGGKRKRRGSRSTRSSMPEPGGPGLTRH